MKRIALLIAETDCLLDGNYLRFANYFLAQSCEVSLVVVDSLRMVRSNICADAFEVTKNLVVDQRFPSFSHPDSLRNLEDFDLCWLLGLGLRDNFLDKIQLLYNLPNPLINSLDAIMYLKSKYFLASKSGLINYPQTWASTDPEYLHDIVKREGGRWIAKPPAGSLGRDVFLLKENDPNLAVILETITGHQKEHYCLLQRYVEEIEFGEKRVLLANGKPVGQYLRTAVDDHRTNVMQGARASLCDLSAEEKDYCERVGAVLQSRGAHFVGLDLAYPWVIEVNVINPGGLTTIDQLGGGDLTARVVAAVMEGLNLNI